MRRLLMAGGMLLVTAAAPAMAMDRYDQVASGGSRAAMADPDKGLERLAAAGQTDTSGPARSARGLQSVLRDDPYLREAIAGLNH